MGCVFGLADYPLESPFLVVAPSLVLQFALVDLPLVVAPSFAVPQPVPEIDPFVVVVPQLASLILALLVTVPHLLLVLALVAVPSLVAHLVIVPSFVVAHLVPSLVLQVAFPLVASPVLQAASLLLALPAAAYLALDSFQQS